MLTPEREIGSIDEIEVGRHGLIVEQGSRTRSAAAAGADRARWDRETFLDHTCLKAGLPADAWRRGARMFVFEAQVFGEGDPQWITSVTRSWAPRSARPASNAAHVWRSDADDLGEHP